MKHLTELVAIRNEIKLASLLSRPAQQIQELLKIWVARMDNILELEQGPGLADAQSLHLPLAKGEGPDSLSGLGGDK